MRFIRTFKSRDGKPIDFREAEASIKKVALDFNIALMYIYGSYASGRGSKLSDLDIGFLTHGQISLDEQLSLLGILQDIFEEEAIDLVDFSRAPLTLIHRALKEGRCIYARSLSEKVDFEVRHECLYLDAEPLRREYELFLTRRIEDGTFGHR